MKTRKRREHPSTTEGCFVHAWQGIPQRCATITENRIQFASEYHITGKDHTASSSQLKIRLAAQRGGGFTEAWRTASKDAPFVLLCSMDGGGRHTLEALGFKRTEPMFCFCSATWARTATRREVWELLRQLKIEANKKTEVTP